MFKMTTVSVNAQFKTVEARGPKIALYLKSHHWFNKQYIKQGVYRPFLGHPENLGGFPGPREFGRFLAPPREFLRFLTPPREFDVFIPHTEIRARVNWPVVD